MQYIGNNVQQYEAKLSFHLYRIHTVDRVPYILRLPYSMYVRTVRIGCPAYIHVYRACDAHLALFGMSCILILPGFWIHASPSTCTATGSVKRIVIYRARREGRRVHTYVRTSVHEREE